MQSLRTLSWRLLSVAFLGLLGVGGYQTYISEPNALSEQTQMGLIAAFVGGFLLKTKFIMSGSSLVHECGHAMLQSLSGNRVNHIKLNRDASGETAWFGNVNRLQRAAVSLAGPLASPIFFLFTTMLILNNLAHAWLLFVVIATVLVVLTTLRNFWAMLTGFVVAAILIYVFQKSVLIGSADLDGSTVGVWASSTYNLAIFIGAFIAGIELRYSIGNRRGLGQTSDEARFAAAMGVAPGLGARIIVVLSAAVSAFAIWLCLEEPTQAAGLFEKLTNF